MATKAPRESAPDGTRPMMISMREMETLELKTGTGLRETVASKVFTRQYVLEQIAQAGFVSPFHGFRAEIAKMAPDDKVLIVADPDEVYGENWLLCLTRQAFNTQMELLQRREQDRLEAQEAQEKEASDAADAKDLSKIVYQEKPMLPRPWMSVTARETHDDVEALSIKPSRPLIRMSVTKMSEEFHADYKFNDREAAKCFVEWRQHKDPNYDLMRMEQDIGLQSTLPLVDSTTQTSWFRSVNSALQYEPIVMEPAQRQAEMDSANIQSFLRCVLPRVERALQQNETLDVFLDPFAHLFEEEDASLGNKNNQNVVRELRSFTDLVYSKNKTLPAIDWHPRRPGVIAVAAAANASFTKRLDLLDTVESSFILIWNFIDLIHPQLMLEAPQDVLTMRINPMAPHLIAAGLFNGQVLVWDFSKADHLLSKLKSTKTSSESSAAVGSSASSSSSSSRHDQSDDDKLKQVPPVKPLYVSYIDVSHRRPVADLHWLPAGLEVNSRGHLVASTGLDAMTVNQFVTIAADGQVSFWDLRFKDPRYRGTTWAKMDKTVNGSSSSWTKDIVPDVHFVPIYSITLTKLDSPRELTLQSFCFEQPREEKTNGTSEGTSGASSFTSYFYCGTEEGEFIYADWRPHASNKGNSGGPKAEESTRSGKDSIEYVQWLCRDHSRPISSLCASPFFPNIFLTASESHFHLWNVAQHPENGATGDKTSPSAPIFVSPLATSAITCVAFSPSRPGVLFLGKSDGMLEVWDFLDQSHRSSLSIGVTACALTSIEFRPSMGLPNPNAANSSTIGALGDRRVQTSLDQAKGRKPPPSTTSVGGTTNATPMKQQLVAVGDEIGNLHILEVPRTLSRPLQGERSAMDTYWKRESERLQPIRHVSNAVAIAAPAKTPLTGLENDSDSMRFESTEAEEDAFKHMENAFCHDMGLETAAPPRASFAKI